jgi:thiamine biosynthesis lipoprotein
MTPAPPSVFAFTGIGTGWTIDTRAPLPEHLRAAVLELVERFDRTYSRFRDDSLVTEIARARSGGSFSFPDLDEPLFALYDRLWELSDGAVDPTVGLALEALGYDATYTLRPTDSPPQQARASWRCDVVRQGMVLSTKRPLVIDIGAAGKGYLIDRIADLLQQQGIQDFVVDGSGDIRHLGGPTIRVGLENPHHPSHVIGVVELSGRSLCASSISRRAWGENLHHILDARTGTPTRAVTATWVLASDAATADALATALFFAEPTRIHAVFDFEWVRILQDGRVQWSDNFSGELFI